MIVAPAVDLREGRCVQLVGGRPEQERVSLPDPVAVARRWWDQGFAVLHVVDLDAALGLGDNRDIVRSILQETPAVVQVGGGVRTGSAAAELLELGARRVVVGTRGLEDPEWLTGLSQRHPGKIMVALDTRDGEVQARGWTSGTGVGARELAGKLGSLPLAGILWTDVDREGRMEGIAPSLAREILEASAHPVWVSGGVSSMEDLSGLSHLGARGAVVGMALYETRLDPQEVAARYGAVPDEQREEP